MNTYSATPPARTATAAAASILARTLFFDTETIPTQRQDVIEQILRDLRADPVTGLCREPATEEEAVAEESLLAQKIHETCLDAAFGQLAVISLAFGEEEPINIWDPHWQHPGYETWLLAELYRVVRQRVSNASRDLGPIVGHNIAFDRDFICQRALVLGVPALPIFTAEVKPWENEKVYDTMLGWSGDIRKRITQDKLCRALGIAGKGSDLDDGEYIDGSQVWDFIQAGRIRDVATYCGGDVKRARLIYKRLKGLEPVPARPEFTPTRTDQLPLVAERRAVMPAPPHYMDAFDESKLEP